jgi:hypothetical protein
MDWRSSEMTIWTTEAVTGVGRCVMTNTVICLRGFIRALSSIYGANKMNNFVYQNQLDAPICQIYFGNEILHVSTTSSVHHQEFFTVQTAMIYVIQFCWQLVSRSICSCTKAVSITVWHISLLCVQWNSPDYGQRNCPKHVEFQCKNKFEKLVHLVSFIIRNLSRYIVTWRSK